MKIHLDPHFSKYTNDMDTHEVCADTIQQGIAVLCNRYPQLLVQLSDSHSGCRHTSSLSVNGVYLTEYSEARALIDPSTVVCLANDIPAGAGQLGSIIAGVVMIIVGIILIIYGGPAGAFTAAEVFEVAVGMIIGGVVSIVMSIIMTPDIPDAHVAEYLINSATYTFDGAKNTTAAGTAIPIVYGLHRAGGHWLNVYTTVETSTEIINGTQVNATNSVLYGQLGVCEGLIDRISDVMVNNLPINYFNEITTTPQIEFSRNGLVTQEVMPDFTITTNTVSVNRKITPITGGVPVHLFTQAPPTPKPLYGYIAGGAGAYEVKQGLYTSSAVGRSL